MRDGDSKIALQDICGIAEVAEIIGRTKGRIDQLLLEDRAFPRPIWAIKLGRIWDRSEIVAWVQLTGYGGKPKVTEVKETDKPEPLPLIAKPSEAERAAKLDLLLGRV